MFVLWVIGAVLGVLVTAALLFAAFLGVFRSTKVARNTFPATRLAYKFFVGDYQKDVPTEYENTWLKASKHLNGTECSMVGIYYDEPEAENVDKSKCRFAIGIVMKPEDKPLEKDMEVRDGFHFIDLPETEAFHVSMGLCMRFFKISLGIAVWKLFTAMAEEKKKRKDELKEVVYLDSFKENSLHVYMVPTNVDAFKVPQVQ